MAKSMSLRYFFNSSLLSCSIRLSTEGENEEVFIESSPDAKSWYEKIKENIKQGGKISIYIDDSVYKKISSPDEFNEFFKQ